MRMIPNDFWNQKFFTLFRFWGIPKTPKIFFSKNIFFKKFSRAQFSIFFDGTGLKRKINWFRTYVQSRLWWFRPFKVFFEFFPENCKLFGHFANFRTPKGQNLHNRLCTYVRNWNIFHLRPVPSKNIENCALGTILKKIFFEKKFSGFRGFPKNKKG